MDKEYPMKKPALLLILFPLLLGSCNRNKDKDDNVSVLENTNSLINQWFGKDHYKEDKTPLKKVCESESEEDSPPLLLTPGGLVFSTEESTSKSSSTHPQMQQSFSQYLFTHNTLNSAESEEEKKTE